MPTDFKSWFDIISQTMLIILGGMVFLQIRVAKNGLQVRSEREAGAISTELANRFATKIIPEIIKFYLKVKDKKHELKPLPLKDFYPEERDGLDLPKKELYDEGVKFFKANQDLSKNCTMILNSFEALAMNFTKGVADEEVVFTALARLYCSFVEKSFPVLCAMRDVKDERRLNLYENTLELYGEWLRKIEFNDLSLQNVDISERMNNLKLTSKNFTPTGMKRVRK